MGYCVMRTDLMTGTADPAALVSCRVYDGEGHRIAVENGTMVELQGYEVNNEKPEREVMKAVLATASSPKNKCAIVCSVEMMYDERKKNLDEFVNEAGAICRAYIPRSQNKFSVTKEGFGENAVPTVGQAIGVDAGKYKVVESGGFGVCLAIEQTSRYTYYVICVD